MIKSPFKFLDSYSLDDRNTFFGRDQEITDLFRKVLEGKILLVYGISGTGKSSLVNCGLASKFDQSDWLPINVRRGGNIIDSLNEAVNRHAITSLKKTEYFLDKIQSLYLDHFKPMFLIFDQFEELFIFGTSGEKKEFLELIKDVVRSRLNCNVIFVIREEFLAGMTEFDYDLPEIFSNRFRVEKMKKPNAISAIEGPCKVSGIGVEPGFSEELINKLTPSGIEVELTYLQIYLDRIFKLASENKTETEGLVFSNELLNKAGSVSDLLGQFLEEQIRELDDPETGMSILKSFVSVQGTKRQMEESDIIDSLGAFGAEISDTDLIKYLHKFVDLRILREKDETGHFELRHDALAAKIFEKFTLLEKELLEVRIFVENALLAFNTRKTYLSGDDLDYLSTYEKRLLLPATLSKFVEDSKEKLHSQQRALRRLTTLVAIIFLIIVSAGVQFYLNKKGSADTKELTTLALLQEKIDPLTSIKTAFKIRQKDSVSTENEGIILSSYYKLLLERSESGDTTIPKEVLPRAIPVTGSVLSMCMNKAGKDLFGWTDSKEIFSCGISDTKVKSFKVDNEILIVEMSDNGRYLAVIYENSKGDVYSPDGKKLFAFETTVNQLMNNRLVRFFPSGKYFMAAVKDNNAMIYDSTGSILFDLKGHTGRVNSLDISPDGRFVVTASSDKSALIWNFNFNTHKFSPYDTIIRYKDKKLYSADSIFGPSDTIWSCEFNNTGKYILAASADSLLSIWNLKGEAQFEFFNFFMNSIYGNCGYGPTFQPRLRNPERHFLYMPYFYQKVYDARFATNHGAIVASNYSYNNTKDRGPDSIFRTQVVYWDDQSFGTQQLLNDFSLMAQSQSDSLQFHSYKSWEITSDNRILASVFNYRDGIMLIASGGYQMLSIAGTFPKFSNDGKYLFYLQKKSIGSLPLNISQIHSLVFEKKIFGNPKNGNDIWKIY